MTAPENKQNITKEELLELIGTWAKDNFGDEFLFRPHQQETAANIIWNWLHNQKNVILDAPTGSGKSIVAMTVAGVLSSHFGKSGYILISDLSLLQQYANDCELYFPDWGVIRGQNTYKCAENGFPFPAGTCKLRGCTSYSSISSEFSHCAPYCEYLLARNKAINSKVTICTYSFWLIHQNSVKRAFENENRFDGVAAPFSSRDFVICDECHKLVDIVQNHFSPRFGVEDMGKISSIIYEDTNICKKNDTIKKLNNLRESIYKEENNDKILEMLKEYVAVLKPSISEIDKIKLDISNKGKKISKSDEKLIRACDFYEEHYSKFNEYYYIIKQTGANYIVKNNGASYGAITFNCLNESYLMTKTFHRHANNALYMSATVGDPEVYAKNQAIKSYASIKLPSVFDYTNSPIYFVNEYKMSAKELEYSFPNVLKMVEKLLDMYKDKRGIIQTGSYKLAEKLYNSLPVELKKRVLLYDNARDKEEKLDEYKFSDNKVLVGPTLVEGISLNDDLCRFQIMLKVPYPSLSDKLTVAKKNFNYSWYNNVTAISVLQGLGRGVRNDKDWCITFILDACFYSLFNSCPNMFDSEFKKRLQIINSNCF